MPSKTKTKKAKKQTTTKTTIKPTTKPGINITITNEVKQPEVKKQVRRKKTKSVLGNFLDAYQNQKVQTFGLPIPNQAPLSTHQAMQLGLAPPSLPPVVQPPLLPAPPFAPALPAPPILPAPPPPQDRLMELMSILMPRMMSNNMYTQDYSFVNEDPSILAINDENRRFEIIDETLNNQIENTLNNMHISNTTFSTLLEEENKRAEERAIIQQRIIHTQNMGVSSLKSIGTRHANAGNEPTFVHNQNYVDLYKNALESKIK